MAGTSEKTAGAVAKVFEWLVRGYRVMLLQIQT